MRNSSIRSSKRNETINQIANHRVTKEHQPCCLRLAASLAIWLLRAKGDWRNLFSLSWSAPLAVVELESRLLSFEFTGRRCRLPPSTPNALISSRNENDGPLELFGKPFTVPRPNIGPVVTELNCAAIETHAPPEDEPAAWSLLFIIDGGLCSMPPFSLAADNSFLLIVS